MYFNSSVNMPILKEDLMEDNKNFTRIMWVVVVVGIIAIVGLGIFAATGLNYSFPDLTKILPL